ncbi:MAG TPA: hypothetical protein VG317_11945 [Pseudonocardiaceae bacterium]|jgi:hypothetical protein|nr:hypothetical protein [Pseudonocardiaceae bacterium]
MTCQVGTTGDMIDTGDTAEPARQGDSGSTDVVDPESSGRAPVAWLSRWWPILLPGALYLGVRALGVLLLWWMAASHQQPLDLHAWDGNWYLQLSKGGYEGYPTDPNSSLNTHNMAMAFFPAYPVLVHYATPVFFGNRLIAALAVSTVAGVAAAYGVARLTQRLSGSRSAGLVMVVLFAAAPMSIVYSMVYPEAVQCALVAWSLVGVVERNWLLAGWCATIAGLVRPIALPLIVVVMIAAAVALIRRRGGWPAWVALLSAPYGLVMYVVWVSIRTGSLTGYFTVQQGGWSERFDGGQTTVQWVANTLTASNGSPFTVLGVLLLIGSVALVGYSVRRLPWPVWIYGALTVVNVATVAGVMDSKVRQLLPAFVLLIPLAIAIARRHPARAAAITVLLAGVGLWYSAYGLTVWPYAI